MAITRYQMPSIVLLLQLLSSVVFAFCCTVAVYICFVLQGGTL